MIRKLINIRDISDEEYARAYEMIPTKRRRRLGRIRSEAAFHCSVAGDMLARACVAELSGCSPAAVVFAQGEFGKPYAASCGDVEFNISHSGEYAVCVADTLPVGVDIEQLRDVRVRIARRLCTPNELLYVFGEPRVPREEEIPPARLSETFRRLLTIWTLKEAYLKNIGVGISAGLKSVEFEVDDDLAVRCSVSGFRFTLDFSIAGYVLAVCETER